MSNPVQDEFKEERARNRTGAWRGYFRFFSHRNKWVFRFQKGLHTVRCQSCHVSIPPQVPRLDTVGSWSYHGGHYCMACAIKMLETDIHEKTDATNTLMANLENLKEIESLCKRTQEKKAYKDIMIVCELLKKTEGTR